MAETRQPCEGSGKPPKGWTYGFWQEKVGGCSVCRHSFKLTKDGMIRRHSEVRSG